MGISWFHSQPSAKNLAKDYDTFIQCVRQHSPTSKISGPGSAFWPRIGEAIKPLSNLSAPFLEYLTETLDIVDWHYYPFQSSRSPVKTRAATVNNILSPNSLMDYEKYSRQLEQLRNKYQPSAQLWTGETGSAQCGGQAKLSDRFVSSFWWADQLGRGAKIGQKVMVRQSLIGGDYALINRQTLKPNPDYWVSWLWGSLWEKAFSTCKATIPLCKSIAIAQKEGKCTPPHHQHVCSAQNPSLQRLWLKKKRFEITADSLTSKKSVLTASDLNLKMAK